MHGATAMSVSAQSAISFFDRFRLVLFDTDKDVFRAEGLFQQQNACDEFIRLFKKKTIIAGDVRLALGGVYDKCVDVGFGESLT